VAPIRVINTRPGGEAARWSAAFAHAGLDAREWPLIDLAPLADTAPLAAAWRTLGARGALMAVSGAAVAHFAAARPEGLEWPGHLRAWATGPGTARAFARSGVAPGLIDQPPADAAQFEAEALWAVVRPRLPAIARVLIVRGLDASGRMAGRPWLAERLREAGVDTDELAAYQRRAPSWGADRRVAAQQALEDGTVWLLSSTEAWRHLAALLPPRASFAAARAVATHPRIAQALAEAGWGAVRVARPDPLELIASIKSYGI